MIEPHTQEREILNDRSVVITLGNLIPTDISGTFHNDLLNKIADKTDFQVSQIVRFDEFDHFCCRVFGPKSLGFETSMGQDAPQWNLITPYLHDG